MSTLVNYAVGVLSNVVIEAQLAKLHVAKLHAGLENLEKDTKKRDENSAYDSVEEGVTARAPKRTRMRKRPHRVSKMKAGGPGSGRHKGFGAKNKFGKPLLTFAQKTAIANYKPTNAKEQRLADKVEVMVKEAVHGVSTPDHSAFDVLTQDGKHAIEVKALLSNKADKITMHHIAIQRKLGWAAKNGATAHTVVVDLRSSHNNPTVYHKEGVGSFRIGSMTPVKGGLSGIGSALKG